MSAPTISYAADWGPYLAGVERGPAHVTRSTTSSRRPGKAIEGVVVSKSGVRVEVCSDCLGLRFNLGGAHAPKWSNGRQVDCAGRVLS